MKLNDGSLTDYGYGWFTDKSLPVPALSHDGQTAGFVAGYLRVPDRDLAIVVFANRYGAPIAVEAIARLVEPDLRELNLVEATNADKRRTQRVREIALTAARAQTNWREEWFTAELWRDIKSSLPDIESTYRRRGPLQSVTPVGPGGVQDMAKPRYRIVFEKMTRVSTFEFDEDGRIKSIQSEDE